MPSVGGRREKYVLPSSAPSAGSGVPAWISIRSSDGKATEPDPSIVSFFGCAASCSRNAAAAIVLCGAFSAKTGDRPDHFELQSVEQRNHLDRSRSDIDDAIFGERIVRRNGFRGVPSRATAISKPTASRRAKAANRAAPSHDGTKIAWPRLRRNSMNYGVAVLSNDADIKTIPFNNRQGGTATPLPGASDPSFSEFYPIYSPNDKVLAFDRLPANVRQPERQRQRRQLRESERAAGLRGAVGRCRNGHASRCERSAGRAFLAAEPQAFRTAGRSGRRTRPTSAAKRITGLFFRRFA